MFYLALLVKSIMLKNLTLKPINLKNRDTLVNWLIDVHNSVNVSNGKRKLPYQSI